MYHRFNENKYPSTNIQMDVFTKQINIIKDKRYEFENPKNFDLTFNKPKSKKKILLTIDDAFSSFYENAWPFLKKNKIPFILFISTEAVGKYGYMDWKQIKEIEREEFAFTSAGVTAVQSAIDGTGNFTFGVMDSAVDHAYSEGGADDGTYIGSSEGSAAGGTGVYLSNYSGTTRDPRIIITYTPAASGYGHESIGVASANISKINAVATANISKFIGV